MPRKTRAKNEQPPNIKKEDGHIKKAGQKRPYQCQLCEKSYQTNAILHSHFNTHTDKYKCDVCGRKNRSSTALNIHRRIHTGEKPFGCQKCDYSASDKSSLRQHLLTCKGAKKEVRMQSVSRDVTLEDSMRDYRPLRDVELEEEVDDYLQLNSPFGKAYVPSSGALPPPREPVHDHFRPSAELFQPDWTDNGNQPERFEGYDPGHVEEPRTFQMKGFEFARQFRRKASNSPAVAKTRSDTGLHVKMDRVMQEIKALSIKSSDGMNCLVEGLQKQNEYLMQENEKIGRAHQEAMESVLKMSEKFDQALELLKQHQNIPRPRRLISSASSDDESEENTPQAGRPKHRKTRRQRKKLISKKKEPQESEGEFITPINFNLAERCVFCWQNDHSSDDCSNYSRMKWRVGIKNFRMLCSLCLCFHPSRICFRPPTCPYCHDTDHHPAICPSDAHMAFLEQLAAAANES